MPLWLVPLLVVPLALAGWTMRGSDDVEHDPSSLGNAALVGPRQVRGPVCVAVTADVSGSMEALAGVRDEAVAELVRFAEKELQPDDLLALVSFDDTAALALAPTRIGDLTKVQRVEPFLDGRSTLFTSAVRQVVEAFAGRPCTSTGMAVVSDGEFRDSAQAIAGALSAAKLTRVGFFVPNDGPRPDVLTAPALADLTVERFLPGDAGRLGLLYGHLLADLTGQRLRGRSA